MPLPSDSDLERHREEVRNGLRERGVDIPKGWDIDIEVKPYLGFDIQYGFKRDSDGKPNGLWFLVYSARYPSTWYGWLNCALGEIAQAYLGELRTGVHVVEEIADNGD